MSSARRPSGEEVFLGDLIPGEKGLTCTICGVGVRLVPEHDKNDGTVHVRRYVGLKKNAEHADNCTFGVSNALNNVVAESNAATGHEMFGVAGDTVTYRLNILDAEMAKVNRELRFATKGEPILGDRFRNEYESYGRMLSPYLRSATAVARLYARLDSGAEREFRRRVVVSQRGRLMEWSRFCYDRDRYETLARRLDGGDIDHSVAIVFRVVQKRSRPPRIRLDSEDVQFEGVRAQVLLSVSPEIADLVEIGTLYVAVGKVFKGDFSPSGIFPIRMMIDYKAQIAEVFEASRISDRPGRQAR